MSLTPSAHRSYRNLDSRTRANRVRPPRCFRVPAAAISAARTSRSTRLGADQSRIARSPVRPLNRRDHNSGTPMWGIFRFVGRFAQRSLPALSEAMGCAIGIPHRSPHRINHRGCHACPPTESSPCRSAACRPNPRPCFPADPSSGGPRSLRSSGTRTHPHSGRCASG
jgi:hypothetical protein